MDKNLLAVVQQKLHQKVGALREVADSTGIPYDTVLRIKNGEGDPGYSKVQAIYDYFTRPKRSRSN